MAITFAATALLIAGAAAPQAEPVTLSGEISASLAGVPVAAGGFEAVVAGGRYRVSGYGGAAGVARLFSGGEARAEARGQVSGTAVVPADYRHELKDRRDVDRVRIAFAGERVDRVAIEPPPRPRHDRVPLAEEHLRGVLDPLSAVMLLSAGPPGPQLCERTLPVFDGKQRYDVELSFARTDRIRGTGGAYSGPAYVCAIRYRPIAGHRPSRSAVTYPEGNDGMEIWLAAVGEAVVAPVKARADAVRDAGSVGEAAVAPVMCRRGTETLTAAPSGRAAAPRRRAWPAAGPNIWWEPERNMRGALIRRRFVHCPDKSLTCRPGMAPHGGNASASFAAPAALRRGPGALRQAPPSPTWAGANECRKAASQ